jgi:hypothetical protein
VGGGWSGSILDFRFSNAGCRKEAGYQQSKIVDLKSRMKEWRLERVDFRFSIADCRKEAGYQQSKTAHLKSQI